MKKEKAITLISLVITIVVLIILASVGIYLSLGNNGIFTRAKEAKELTNKQQATEIINLKITTAKMNKYAEEQRMPTLKELSEALIDDEIQYVTEKSQVASTKYEVGESPSSIYTKLKKYPYEFYINGELQIVSIDGIEISKNNQTASEMGEYFYKSYNGFENTLGIGKINSLYGLTPMTYEDSQDDDKTLSIGSKICRYEKNLNYSFDLSKKFEISFKSIFITSNANSLGGIRIKFQKRNNENNYDDIFGFIICDHWVTSDIGLVAAYDGEQIYNKSKPSSLRIDTFGIVGDENNIRLYNGDELLTTCEQKKELSFDKIVIDFYGYPGNPTINKIYLENLYFGNINYYKDII